MRKGRTVKADDLLPLEPVVQANKPTVSGEAARKSNASTRTDSTTGKVSLKDIDFGLNKDGSSDEDEGEVKSEPRSESEDDEDDFIDTEKLNKQRREDDEELKKILDEENEELANMLSKTRRQIVVAPLSLEVKAERIEPEENGIDFDK